MASTEEIKFPSQPPHWHLTSITILPQIARTIYDPRGEVDKDVKNLPQKAAEMHELLLLLGFILVLDFKQ